jgi:hypothetical protein
MLGISLKTLYNRLRQYASEAPGAADGQPSDEPPVSDAAPAAAEAGKANDLS